MTNPIPKSQWSVHEAHCCPRHGCKYGEDEFCPVVNRLTPKYNHSCEDCENDKHIIGAEKDTPLSKAKLVARLTQYMVDTNKTTMDPNLFFWCSGGNSRVAALLIDIANNEFEMGDGE